MKGKVHGVKRNGKAFTTVDCSQQATISSQDKSSILAGNNHLCYVALLHHPGTKIVLLVVDPYKITA